MQHADAFRSVMLLYRDGELRAIAETRLQYNAIQYVEYALTNPHPELQSELLDTAAASWQPTLLDIEQQLPPHKVNGC